MKKLLLFAALAAAIWLLWKQWSHEGSAAGAFLESAPNQNFTLAIPFRKEGYTLYPVATFEVDARLFGRKSYDDGSDESRLSPVDLALGWGPLADERIAEQISVTQSGRFYHWRTDRLPMPAEKISQHSANMHIIPAGQEVTRFIDTLTPGQRISLRGKLVNVSGPDNWRWVTSQTRNDTGDGACEVFYVERASLIPQPGAQQEAAKPMQAAIPTPRQPAQPRATAEERSVKIAKTKTFVIPYGSVTVPAGDAVRIAAEKGSKVKAVYRGIEFWVERKELE